MAGFLSALFGGYKSEKDVKVIKPYIAKINAFFDQYQSLTNDELRNKTVEFKSRINEFLVEIDNEIEQQKVVAEGLDSADISGRDAIYQGIDAMKKDRDKKLETILLEILPEAFAVVKETARRFKENDELVSAATQLDRDFSVTKKYITIDGDKAIYKNKWIAGGTEVT